MSNISNANGGTTGPLPILIDRVVSLLTDLWTNYSIRRARRTTIEILRSLDDQRLKDIGLRRSEIESVVCNDRAERLLR